MESDKDSSNTEPEQTPVTPHLQMSMVSGSGSSGGVRQPKKRRRMLDGSNNTLGSSSVDRPVDYFEPQIVSGVGGDTSELPVTDYYDGFGQYVANEIRQMDRQSVIIAKRLINEVLFLGQMGMLNVHTRIETPSSRPTTGKKSKCSRSAENQQHGDESPTVPRVEFMETP